MQRLFSTFPGGWPGIALLFLRSTTGVVLIAAGLLGRARLDRAPLLSATFAVTAAGSGLSLLLGFFTPVGGVLGALCSAAAPLFAIPMDTLDSTQLMAAGVVVGVTAAALGVLGPGAFSIDCYLFGRRKIIIPKFPPPRDCG